MNTWVNRRTEYGAYNIDELLNDDESAELLSASGEGQSYLVSGSSGRKVIKVYKGRLTRELETVLRTVTEMRHPAIARIFSYGELSGHAYEIREYYESRTLAESPQSFITAVTELSDAINELHLAGFSGLDIKPENIVITSRSALIVDVGSFTYFGSDEISGHTLTYSAPELTRGMGSACSDYYSLGLTLLNLITGHDPISSLMAYRGQDCDKTDIYNIKINPGWWFPDKEKGTSIGQLISGLVEPDQQKRWGYSRILDWLRIIDPGATTNGIAEMNERFSHRLMYNNAPVGDYGELFTSLLSGNDVKYMFSQGTDLAYSSMYLSEHVGLFIAYRQQESVGTLGYTDQLALLVSLFCEFTKDSDGVFFDGRQFSDIFELGNYVFSATKEQYDILNGNRSAAYPGTNNGMSRLLNAAAAGIFSKYMIKCRKRNTARRAQLIEKYERELSKSADGYDRIYSLTRIAYLLMDINVYKMRFPAQKNETEFRSLPELVEKIKGANSNADNYSTLLKSLTYKDKISPIIKAWSDHTKEELI